jgi:HD-GYP domain-containing protein (c-di-GMP phosphodiesterase class II)
MQGLFQGKSPDGMDNELLAPFLTALPPLARPSVAMLLDCLYRHDLGRTFAHSVGVAVYAGTCAQLMGMGHDVIEEISLAGLLHDVGKIAVERAVLLKPLPLEPAEFASLRLHPAHSEQLLRRLPGIIDITRCVRAHHERWDGTGYPDCLQGEQIPLLTRIITVADSFDAMTRDRTYRLGMPTADAIIELQAFSGRMFDPAIVEVFQDLIADRPNLVASKPEVLAPLAASLLAARAELPL